MSEQEDEALQQALRGERPAKVEWRDPQPMTAADRIEFAERGLEVMRAMPDISPERVREILAGPPPGPIKLDPDIDPIW